MKNVKPTQPEAGGAAEHDRGLDKWPLWICLAAVAVRVVYFTQFAGSPLLNDFGVDHRYYLGWATQIAGGDWLGTEVFEQGPLYAYLLGVYFRLCGSEFDGEQVVGPPLVAVYAGQMLLGAVLCVLVYLCGRRLFDWPAAAVAGLIAAVYGPFVFYECMTLKSFLSPLLTTAALYFGLRFADARSSRWIGLAGLAVGLACLERENHGLLALPLALWIWTCPANPPPSRRRRLSQISVLCVSVALCLVPSALRNWWVAGEFVAVTAGGGEVFYMGWGPAANGYYTPPDFVLAASGVEHADFRQEARRREQRPMTHRESSRYWFREGLRSILQDPLRAAGLCVRKAIILFNDYEVLDSENYQLARRFIPLLAFALPTFGWIGGLGFLGLAVCGKDFRRFQLPLGFAAMHIVTVLLVYNFGRFRLGLMPVWILFAARGLLWLSQRLLKSRNDGSRLQRTGQTTTGLLAVILITAFMFRPLEPPLAQVQTAFDTGRLANRGGDYELAERELRLALQFQTSLEPSSGRNNSATSNYRHIVILHELATTLCRTQRADQAIGRFREAKRIPQRTEVRTISLNHEFSLLHDAIRESTPARRSQLREETRNVAKELTELHPNRVQYWAMRALVEADRQFSDEIHVGLDTAWRRIENPSPIDTAWYKMGRACLLIAAADTATARVEARAALEAWPEHRFRTVLENIDKLIGRQ